MLRWIRMENKSKANREKEKGEEEEEKAERRKWTKEKNQLLMEQQ